METVLGELRCLWEWKDSGNHCGNHCVLYLGYRILGEVQADGFVYTATYFPIDTSSASIACGRWSNVTSAKAAVEAQHLWFGIRHRGYI